MVRASEGDARPRFSDAAGDIAAPAVELVLGEAVFSHEFVLEVLVGSGDLDFDGEASVFLVMELDLDRGLSGQVGRQVADGAFAELGAVFGRGAFSLDDFHADRALVGFLRFENSFGGDGEAGVAGDDDGVSRAASGGFGGDDAEAVGVDVADLELGYFAVVPGEENAGVESGALGDGFVG